jgi:hypothetical protein
MINSRDNLQSKITKIAKTFGIFDCIPCSIAIKQFLIQNQVQGKQIIVKTGSQDPIYGRIYDDSIGELIATTGHHEGISVIIEGKEFVFDNLHPQGINKVNWLTNLYSPILDEGKQFNIQEIAF